MSASLPACLLLLVCFLDFWPPLAYHIPARDTRAPSLLTVACYRLWPLIQTFWIGRALLSLIPCLSAAPLFLLVSPVPRRLTAQPMLSVNLVAVYDPLRPLTPVLDFKPIPTLPDRDP